MATSSQWARGYARQADADFKSEYPWEDGQGTLHLPLDWSFHPSELIVMPAGRTVLKLIRGSLDRLLE